VKDQEIIKKLKEVISQYVDDESVLEKVSMDAHLTKDLDVNSASIIDIVLDVEEAFDIEIDDESIGQMETIGSCVEILRKNVVLA